jgi:hypothetical protein
MAFNFAKFFRNLFGGSKPSPVPTPVPTPTPIANPLKPIAVIVLDGARPVVGASVALDGSGVMYPLTNGDGYTIQNVPVTLGASQLYVTAEGFDPYSVHVDLPAAGDLVVGGTAKPGQIQCAPLVSKGVDPSKFSLRELARIRGAMWTVRGPWRFGPRPGSPDNITALEFIYSYGGDPKHLNDEQKAMIAKYKSYGYTHVAFGPPNAESYHGQYPDTNFNHSPEAFDQWLDWLQMFWDNGLAPICFLHGDGQTYEQTVATYDSLIRNNPRAQKLIRIIVPTGWEPTRYGWSSRTWGAFCDWAHEILPNALILIHTESDVDAPVGTDERYDDNGKGNENGWAYVAARIHGWLIQSGAFATPDVHGDPNQPNKTNFDNWADQFDKNHHGSYYDRFHNGYAGWPTFSRWGNEPIYLYAAEFCSYWEYWQNRPYDEGVKWGDRAISVGADGVLDSCSIDVPPARG